MNLRNSRGAGSHWKGGGKGGQYDSPEGSSCGKGNVFQRFHLSQRGYQVISWAEVQQVVMTCHGLTCCFVLWPQDELLPWITLWVTCHRLVWWLYDKWGWFVTAPWATPESCAFRIICRYDMSILQSPSYLHVRLKLLFCTEFVVIDDTFLYTVHLAPHTNCLYNKFSGIFEPINSWLQKAEAEQKSLESEQAMAEANKKRRIVMALFETASLLIRINFKHKRIVSFQRRRLSVVKPWNTLRSWMLIWLDTVIYLLIIWFYFKKTCTGPPWTEGEFLQSVLKVTLSGKMPTRSKMLHYRPQCPRQEFHWISAFLSAVFVPSCFWMICM